MIHPVDKRLDRKRSSRLARALIVLTLAALPVLGQSSEREADRSPGSERDGQHVQDLARASSLDTRRSGFEFMSRATQTLQRHDDQNPAMLWVRDGERLWREPIAPSGKSCLTCHGASPTALRGVAARYPAWDEALGRPVSLNHRISLCRQRYQQTAPASLETDEQLSLEALIALQSRGVAIEPVRDPRLATALEQGRAQFFSRIGQLALACHHCHDQNAGARLGGSPIPQAHPTAYPIYRLQWQAMGSLPRRLRGCFTGVRAEAPEPISEVMVALELFLRDRAAGMPHEGPGVRP
jgi:sulfur-oxidizing protein SoxA